MKATVIVDVTAKLQRIIHSEYFTVHIELLASAPQLYSRVHCIYIL